MQPQWTESVVIDDTTLRDGEQSPGASMTKDEKVRIAKALEKMRVDVIEAGFPIASNGDFEAVKAVASVIKDSTVCGLARAKQIDIDRAGEAIKPANSGRIHTFIATSPIHMQQKLRLSPDQVVEQAVKAARITGHARGVEVSQNDLLSSFSKTIPLSKTMEEQLKAIRSWARTRAVPATAKGKPEM